VLEASLIGARSRSGRLFGAAGFPRHSHGALVQLSDQQVIIAMAIYGFVAAVLPVWVLLVPRDYLSSFLKIGTIALLVIGA
jgi:carbon starvation protein